jgi:hypothetical protein
VSRQCSALQDMQSTDLFKKLKLGVNGSARIAGVDDPCGVARCACCLLVLDLAASPADCGINYILWSQTTQTNRQGWPGANVINLTRSAAARTVQLPGLRAAK